MVEELMQKVKASKEKNSLLYKKNNLEQRRKELEAERSEIEKQLEELHYVKPRNSIVKRITDFFNRTFRNVKYLEGQTIEATYNELNDRDTALCDQIHGIFEEIRGIDSASVEKDKQELDEFSDTMKDSQKSVEYLLQHYPELKGKKEFMLEAVEIEPLKILEDTTNEPEVYKKYMQEVLKKIQDTNRPDMDKTVQTYDKVIQEIENPNQPESGKYKIPQKYLFEGIRISASLIKDKGGIDNLLNSYMAQEKPFLGISGEGHGMVGENNNLESYIKYDCTLPFEYGASLENLYNTENYMLIQHKFDSNSQSGKEKLNNVFFEGKRESTYQEQGNRDLEYTFNGEFSRCGFCGFLYNGASSRVMALIPKKALDPNSNIPLWGSDEIGGPSYLLPEYIVGIEDQNHVFTNNSIPKEERKQYKFHYKNKGKEPIHEEKTHQVDDDAR